MNLSQKKTCRGCIAIEFWAGNKYIQRCGLGYPTQDNENSVWIQPTDICPKPMTNREYVDSETYQECQEKLSQMD